MKLYRTIARFAARQMGLVTLAQALAAGLTRRQVDRLIAQGQWVVVRRGVYAVAGVPPSWEQALLAACLAAGAGAAAAHLTAGRLFDLVTPAPMELDVVTPTGRRVRLPGVRHHRTDTLWVPDLTTARGIPTTTVARTLCDVGGLLSEHRLGLVVNDALRRELVSLDRLRACHDRLALGKGRRSHRAMTALLAQRADGFDPGGSERELWVIDTLVAAGFERPVQQLKVQVDGHTFYLDLAYLQQMVDIEFDGFATHGDFESFHADRRRWRLLASAGWSIVPVTIRTSEQELVDSVGAVLSRTRGDAVA